LWPSPATRAGEAPYRACAAGAGPGPAVVREPADRIGGRIDTKSEIYRGAILTASLPSQIVERADGAQITGQEDWLQGRSPVRGSGRRETDREIVRQLPGRNGIAAGGSKRVDHSGRAKPAGTAGAILADTQLRWLMAIFRRFRSLLGGFKSHVQIGLQALPESGPPVPACSLGPGSAPVCGNPCGQKCSPPKAGSLSPHLKREAFFRPGRAGLQLRQGGHTRGSRLGGERRPCGAIGRETGPCISASESLLRSNFCSVFRFRMLY
jgi:hypothetical protein